MRDRMTMGDGVRLGAGMFIALPLLLFAGCAGCVLLLGVSASQAPKSTHVEVAPTAIPMATAGPTMTSDQVYCASQFRHNLKNREYCNTHQFVPWSMKDD